MSNDATNEDEIEDTLPGIGVAPTLSTLSNRLERLEDGQRRLTVLCSGINTELGELRSFLMADIAPRLTKQETKSAGAVALQGAKWVTLATGAVGLALQAAALINPKLLAPLQVVADFLSKLQ